MGGSGLKYSLKKLDEMRSLLQVLYTTEMGSSLNADIIEERLRTLCSMGKKPKHIRKRIQQKIKNLEKQEWTKDWVRYMKNDLQYVNKNAF